MNEVTVVAGAAATIVRAGERARANTWIAFSDGKVQAIGTGKPPRGDTLIDATGSIVMPGMVCAHHHLSQGTSRGILTPPGLMGWLETHYRRWARLRTEDIAAAARWSIAQLLLSGCTTVATFEYLHPEGEDFVAPVVEASRELGIRLMYVRGTASTLEGRLGALLGDSGVDVDRLIEPPDRGLAAIAEVVGRPTDPMLRWACGPTTPVLDDGSFHRALEEIASDAGAAVHLHFHPIAGKGQTETAVDLARRLGLVRRGNWFAHGSQMTAADVAELGSEGVGVVHCPSTSLRLGYELPSLAAWSAGSDRVAIAVDGAASNDHGSMFGEAQLAWYLQGQPHLSSSGSMASEQVLHMVTQGAALTIGWGGLGTIEEGSSADLAVFDLGGFDGAGAAGGPDEALFRLFTTHQAVRARHVFVGGHPVVTDGRLTGADEDVISNQASASAAYLAAPALTGSGV